MQAMMDLKRGGRLKRRTLKESSLVYDCLFCCCELIYVSFSCFCLVITTIKANMDSSNCYGIQVESMILGVVIKPL